MSKPVKTISPIVRLTPEAAETVEIQTIREQVKERRVMTKSEVLSDLIIKKLPPADSQIEK